MSLLLDGGALPPVPPNANNQQQIAAINSIVDRLNKQMKSIYFSDSQTRRVFIGFASTVSGAGNDFIFKISQVGVDVATATDSQLLFKMDMDTWFWYDANTGKNVMQVGKLEDGEYGWDVALEGYNVSEVYQV